MATKKLYAKDRRKLKRRRWTSVAMTVGGLGALALVGWYLYRKLVADVEPEVGERKDWSGCLGPPEWVQPRPRFSCGDKVRNQAFNEEGYIEGRTWIPEGQFWTYEMFGNDTYHEEVDLVAI